MASDRTVRRTRFHRYIEARWPDPTLEGWDVLQLTCGHKSAIHTVSRDLEKAHCAQCQLNGEEHDRAIAQIQKQHPPKEPTHAEVDDHL